MSYITVQLQDSYGSLSLHFRCNNPKYLTHISQFYTEKDKRILFISGLKYEYMKNKWDERKIYLYTKEDFNRYIQMWKLLYPKIKYIHNKNEVIEFFEGK
jgi:hypothetical protein